MDINAAKELVVKAGKNLVESGLIARTWGNVSCRTSDYDFVITPSGRDYISLTTDEIVTVRISDCSYSGNIKPSSEKGIHAEVYSLYPEANFVIHTHQENASVVGACGLDSIEINEDNPYFGGKVICASYALPGTKKLRRNVKAALLKSKGKAVIMKNHGALCFGKDYDEAFLVACELEKACQNFIARQYLKLSGRLFYNSRRTDKGFELYNESDVKIQVEQNKIEHTLPAEAEIYNAIFNKYRNINYIIHSTAAEIKALSSSGSELKPFLDDFAQIAGTKARNVRLDTSSIISALRNSSVVLIQNNGALCCGKTKDDAIAAEMVTQKASKAFLGTLLLGRGKPIKSLECLLMRFVYLYKYSKQKYIK